MIVFVHLPSTKVLSVSSYDGPVVTKIDFNAILEWLDWVNNSRLFKPIGNISPVEAGATLTQLRKDQT